MPAVLCQSVGRGGFGDTDRDGAAPEEPRAAAAGRRRQVTCTHCVDLMAFQRCHSRPMLASATLRSRSATSRSS